MKFHLVFLGCLLETSLTIQFAQVLYFKFFCLYLNIWNWLPKYLFKLSLCRTVSEKNICQNYWICNEWIKIYELQYVSVGTGLRRDRLSVSLQAVRSRVENIWKHLLPQFVSTIQYNTMLFVYRMYAKSIFLFLKYCTSKHVGPIVSYKGV